MPVSTRPPMRAGRARGPSGGGRPVPRALVIDIDGDDLGRAPTFHLEGEKTVVGADIETPPALDVGPRHLLDDRPQVEEPGGHDARTEVDRVIPERVLGD